MIVGYGHATGPQNSCNACSPPIPDTLYVTLSGLSGDFAQWNGKHALLYDRTCLWRKDEYPDPEAQVDWTEVEWEFLITGLLLAGPVCSKEWTGSEDPCDPTGVYAEKTCNDAGCPDGDSCEDSAGATCVVSLT